MQRLQRLQRLQRVRASLHGRRNGVIAMPDKPTWAMLVAAEPRLADVLRDCRAMRKDTKGDPRFCANRAWYGYDEPEPSDDGGYGLRGRIARLVGWDREGHPLLGTEAAYDVAYDKCYDALPECRDCCCL